MYEERPIGYGNQALGQLVAGITTRRAGGPLAAQEGAIGTGKTTLAGGYSPAV